MVATFGGLTNDWVQFTQISSASGLPSASGGSSHGIVTSGESHRAAELGSSKREMRLSRLKVGSVAAQRMDDRGRVGAEGQQRQ